jgi:hypothetical protein
VKDKRDGAKEYYIAKATEVFCAIFKSEFVLDRYSGAPEDRYGARKFPIAQASCNSRAWEQLFMCLIRFGVPLDNRCTTFQGEHC